MKIEIVVLVIKELLSEPGVVIGIFIGLCCCCFFPLLLEKHNHED